MEGKKCKKCGVLIFSKKESCDQCLKLVARLYAKKNIEKYATLGKCRCSRDVKLGRKQCNVCYTDKRNRAAEFRNKTKNLVFNHYGNKCINCNEAIAQFLTIDHVNGGGKQHCKSIKNIGLYRWIWKNNYPPEFQILCWNCNYLKHYNSLLLKNTKESISRNKEALNKKLKVISHYGSECVCCKMDNPLILCIDHINENGSKHRQQLKQTTTVKGSGISFYRWVIKNNYPPDLQILCFNCNSAKHFYGQCPHQLKTIKES